MFPPTSRSPYSGESGIQSPRREPLILSRSDISTTEMDPPARRAMGGAPRVLAAGAPDLVPLAPAAYHGDLQAEGCTTSLQSSNVWSIST